MKISEGFPKVLDEGGVTAKIYKGFIKGKYDLFTLAYYMDGLFKKENFGCLDDAIARGKKVIRQLKGGEFDGVVMTSQDTKAFFASLKNLEGTGLSLESATKEIAACRGAAREGAAAGGVQGLREAPRRHGSAQDRQPGGDGVPGREGSGLCDPHQGQGENGERAVSV
jgi:hypothetical protein